MELLPLELLELIFLRCEDETLAISVPRICKLSRNITRPNSRIWREKCKSKGQTEQPSKKRQVTWKKIYFQITINLFPLLGHVIGQTTFNQLRKSPGAVIHHDPGYSRYVIIDEHNFHSSEYIHLDIFTSMNIVKGISPIPKAWEEFGITWSRSWRDYKQLLRRWNGNFIVNVAPHYSRSKAQKNAGIASVARHSDEVYYLIELHFHYHEGEETSTNTLYSISITSQHLFQNKSYKDLYEAQKIEDRPLIATPVTSKVANQKPSNILKSLKYILGVGLAVVAVTKYLFDARIFGWFPSK